MDLPVIACSLPPAGLDSRLADWAEVLRGAVVRAAVPGGVQVTLPSYSGLPDRVAVLAAREAQRCSFLEIPLATGTAGMLVLTVTGPDGALGLVQDLLGTPA